MDRLNPSSNIPAGILRNAIRKEYSSVANEPDKGYHFHTGKKALKRIGYDEKLYELIPEDNIASFAGTGNPFGIGFIHTGDVVVDVGSGAGCDALIAAQLVGPTGRVVGIDMTAEMLEKARTGAETMRASHVEFVEGYADDLPLPDNFADVIISNGVLNLTSDKEKTLKNWERVLKPGGRLFIGDISISKKIPQEALNDVLLWTG